VEGEVTAPVRALTVAVDALLAQPAADLPGVQALADATVLIAELERLRALVLTRVADVDSRQLHTLADAPSTGTWLAAQQTSLTRSEVALARRLTAFPTVAAAVDTGTLSVAVAARVAAALVTLRPHLDRPDGLIDGQPAEPTLHAVIVDGVLSLLSQPAAAWTTTTRCSPRCCSSSPASPTAPGRSWSG
jgi:hypothetical protein